MKKSLILFLLLIATVHLQAQIGIGTANPHASSILDISDTTKGVLVPRMTQAQRLQIITPANGLLVYQTDQTKGFWYYDTNIGWLLNGMPRGSSLGDMVYWNGTQWQVINAGQPGQYLQMSSSLVPTWVNLQTATVSAIACSSGSVSATATINVAFTGTATIPYTGGNGVTYNAGTPILSTGVSGLTATLQSGTLSNGNGNLSYLITGTPTGSGTASFVLVFGGQTCTFSMNVNTASGPLMPTVFNKIYGAYSITFDGTYVTIKTYDQPNHKSAYWPTSNALYEAFSGTTFGGYTFVKNPNSIISQNFTIKIPAFPVVAATHQATPLGVIGVAIDGVPFFNQYAGPSQPLTGEIASFDQYWAHPQQTGVYHYHVEPKYLTTVYATKSSLMGFLLDGFPVYGPEEENGSTPTGLDVYHGHTHTTVDYPSGMYHYHFTATAPYLNGNGYYGTAGTVTQ